MTGGFYLVQWTGVPFAVDEPTECEGGGTAQDGDYICEAVYWEQVGGVKNWFTPPSGGDEFNDRYLFRMSNVLCSNVMMDPPNTEPPAGIGRKRKQQVMALLGRRINGKSMNEIELTIERREELEYTQLVDGVDTDNDSNDDGDDGEDEDSSDSDDDED